MLLCLAFFVRHIKDTVTVQSNELYLLHMKVAVVKMCCNN